MSKNATIMRNTMYMYFRMITLIIISLFTARVVFNTLGVEAYGAYGVVGGIIVFFSFINNGLGTATNRYITAEISKGEEGDPRHVFNTCLIAHSIIAIIVLFFAETIGVWVVNNTLNIPPELMYGANWAYQLSVISAILGIIQSPFGVILVANEKLDIYAYLTILDVIFKLLVIYLVQAIQGDKLVIYSSLLFGVSIVNMMIYRIYTFKKFKITHLQYKKDITLVKEIFKFTSISLLGQTAVVGTNQGVSILINVYNGVVVNAAMGVSNSITNIVNGFVSNFQMAFQPQIIKSFNSGEKTYLNDLIIKASRISSFLVIIFLIPLLFEVENVLEIWLGDYPKYSTEFCILGLICIYFEAISAPLWMVIYSHTDIKRYQIVISTVYSLNFILGWVVLFLGMIPYSVLVIKVIVGISLFVVRTIYAKKTFNELDLRTWFKEVIFKSASITLVSVACIGFISKYTTGNSIQQIITTTFFSLLISTPLILCWGFKETERNYIKQYLLKKIRK